MVWKEHLCRACTECRSQHIYNCFKYCTCDSIINTNMIGAGTSVIISSIININSKYRNYY